MEPATGVEPATTCLQNRCSAIELRRRKSENIARQRLRRRRTRTNIKERFDQRHLGERRFWWLPGDSNPEPID